MGALQVVIDVPESVLLAEKMDIYSFAKEIKMLAAVKLFEMGRISSGAAAELAGMSRVDFLMNMHRYRVFPFSAELEDLERQIADCH